MVDLIPGGGYFTRIFSLIVGPKGHVYAVWPSEYAKEDSDEVPLVQALAADPRFANVTMLMQPAAAFSIPEKADVVWTSRNYHDYPDKFMGPTDPKVLDAAVFAALKPGGVFVVIDHVAEAGSGLRDTDTLHRIDPDVVKGQAAAAGFKLDGNSDVLHNPASRAPGEGVRSERARSHRSVRVPVPQAGVSHPGVQNGAEGSSVVVVLPMPS